MAFNKVFMVILLLLAAVALATARVDFSKVSEYSEVSQSALNPRSSSEYCCDNCECEDELSCRCYDRRINQCHTTCATCICTRSFPAYCICVDPITTCPSKCTVTETASESLLALNTNY
ncbi:Proteinase inhibitor I12, Bowman-Birk [Trema orientale]|uniref:Proteinase inhibitor I12, Bowman-Birk n=1 Tax=Trema orientale TaxID=63057 RepID=A0A2P5BUE4_TREOI|nr:Proteinase inhibitor I12, Bowman-Birk [Trema orientale]